MARGSAFHTVIAGEFVRVEQDGVIKDEALGIIVGQFANVGFVRSDDDLTDRLDDVRCVASGRQNGQAIVDADCRHPPESRVFVNQCCRSARLAGHPVEIAAKGCERGDHLSARSDEFAFPACLDGVAGIGAHNPVCARDTANRILTDFIACQRCRVDFEACFPAKNRLFSIGAVVDGRMNDRLL